MTKRKKSQDPQVNELAEQQETTLKHRGKFSFAKLFSTKKRRIVGVVLGVVLVLIILFAIPFTRYFFLGPVVKKDATIKIIDSKTKQPVSNALVTIGSSSAQSDKDGVARLKGVSVGQSDVKVSKQQYNSYSQSYTIPVLFNPESPTLELVANGRRVVVTVTDKISGNALGDVIVSSDGAKATTSSDGTATMILPPSKQSWQATVSKDGYNSIDVELANDIGTKNSYSLTAAGSVYYLSKATGTVNVMKSNLDGTNSKIAVQGTGLENDYQTTLLSSRDWKYSTLLATRADDKVRLYLVDDTKGDFTVMDEGNADFDVVGWSGHNFIYTVTRNTGNIWDDKRQALKSFNADTRKISILDQTIGSGVHQFNYQYEYFNSVYILSDEIVYSKSWNSSQYASFGNEALTSLVSIDASTNEKKVVKTFPYNSATVRLYEPQGIYIRVTIGSDPTIFYEYENKAIKVVTDTNDNKFYSSYPTYLVSPSGKQTLWYDVRDGKNVVFIGDEEGKNEKPNTKLGEYIPYGWYGDDDQYILFSKNGSELYIASTVKVLAGEAAPLVKVTDYHRTRTYASYGYGYGGQ